eukprot:5529544-Pyramimonas_sp.AAC.2
MLIAGGSIASPYAKRRVASSSSLSSPYTKRRCRLGSRGRSLAYVLMIDLNDALCFSASSCDNSRFKACANTATMRNTVPSHGLNSPVRHARLAKIRTPAPLWGGHAGKDLPNLRAKLVPRTTCNDAAYGVL